MTAELLTVGVFVAAAVTYLVWTLGRTIVGTRTGCGSGCGKCAAPAEVSKPGRRALPMAG